MADLTITEIRPTATTRSRTIQIDTEIGTGTGTIAVTSPVLYLDTTDDKYKLADSDSTIIIAGSNGICIAMTFGDDEEYVVAAYGGMLVLVCSPAISEGLVYVLSDTPGGIKPAGDLASGDNCTIIGVGAANNEIDLAPLYASGQTVA